VVEQSERSRVAWADTDAGGRIHFTAALRWAEATETALLRRLGLAAAEWGSYPRRKVEVEFLKVLRFEDEIDVRLLVENVGRTSITYAWTVSKDGEPYIKGRHTVVHVNADGRPEPLEARVRVALEA
jgi:acyl-CoA thioester hydrolase